MDRIGNLQMTIHSDGSRTLGNASGGNNNIANMRKRSSSITQRKLLPTISDLLGGGKSTEGIYLFNTLCFSLSFSLSLFFFSLFFLFRSFVIFLYFLLSLRICSLTFLLSVFPSFPLSFSFPNLSLSLVGSLSLSFPPFSAEILCFPIFPVFTLFLSIPHSPSLFISFGLSLCFSFSVSAFSSFLFFPPLPFLFLFFEFISCVPPSSSPHLFFFSPPLMNKRPCKKRKIPSIFLPVV